MATSNPRHRDDPLGRILSYLVAITTIIGIPAGLYGYYAGERTKRVERTVEFYKDFRAEAFQKKWGLLTDRWNKKASEVNKLLDESNYVDLRLLVTSLVEDESGRGALTQVILFFDGLSACVENSLCDGNAAVALFKDPASEFFSIFGSHLIYVRGLYGNHDYAIGISKVRALEKRASIF